MLKGLFLSSTLNSKISNKYLIEAPEEESDEEKEDDSKQSSMDENPVESEKSSNEEESTDSSEESNDEDSSEDEEDDSSEESSDDESSVESEPEEHPEIKKCKKKRIAAHYKTMLASAKMLHDTLSEVNYTEFSEKEVDIISNFTHYLTNLIKNTETILSYKLHKYTYEKLLILFIQQKTILNTTRDSIKILFDKKTTK